MFVFVFNFVLYNYAFADSHLDLLSPTKKTANPAHLSTGCAVLEIIQSVADHGDHQLVVLGLFENLLKIRFHDPGMGKSSIVSDWLSQSDYFDERTRYDKPITHSVFLLLIQSVNLLILCGTMTVLPYMRIT